MNKEIKCPKCNSDMIKSGIMNSGNSKYTVYKCKKCGEEKLVAMG